MKKIKILVLLIVVFSLGGCSPSESAVQTTIAQTIDAQATATRTIRPTKLPTNTKTLIPTLTPRPTNTKMVAPTKTITSTLEPVPDPIIYSGSGSKILDIDDAMLGEARIVDITSEGSSNFSVKTYDANNNPIDLLVNTIGNYTGRHAIDWKGENTKRFEIKANGNWSFTFYPIAKEYMHVADASTPYIGQGDDVVVIQFNPDIGIVDCQTRGNLAIWAISYDGSNLVVNEIAPYFGEFLFPNGTRAMFVTAPGEWTFAATER
jgi:hypothetical protein